MSATRQIDHEQPAPRAAPERLAALAPRGPIDARALTPEAVLRLQRTAGNAAVGRLLRARTPRRLDRQSTAPVRTSAEAKADAAADADHAARAAALCVGDDLFKGPPTVEFSPQEKRRIEATYWSARSLAGRATQALSTGDPYLKKRAAAVLHEDDADLSELAATAAKVHQALVDTPFVRGTCASPVCTVERGDGTRAGGIMADAAEDHSRITICPFFFMPTNTLAEQVRTWLHEGGHLAGIDDPPPGVPYEHPPNCYQQRGETPFETPKPVDCSNACPGGDKHNVDNWAYFLDCVGGGS